MESTIETLKNKQTKSFASWCELNCLVKLYVFDIYERVSAIPTSQVKKKQQNQIFQREFYSNS